MPGISRVKNEAPHRHERRFRFGKFCIARTENGVVRADMYIVGILAEGDGRKIGDIGVCLILGGGDARRVSVNFSFLPCLLGEVARHDIVRLPLMHQVEGNGGKLRGGAPLHEEYGVVFGDPHEFAQQRFAFAGNGLERLAAVGDLRNGHARPFKVEQIALRLAQYVKGERGRPCREIVSPHGNTSHDG